MRLEFDRFIIQGADNQIYQGIRPSLIPKPFKSVIYKYDNEKNLTPKIPRNINPNFILLGFDACFVVQMIGMNDSQEIFIKLIAIFKEEFSTFHHHYLTIFTQDGKFVKEFWEYNK